MNNTLNMVRCQVVSDLHLEFQDYTINNESNVDVLILSGDICITSYLIHGRIISSNTINKRFCDFFEQCSLKFPHIVYVMGNHEHYNGNIHLSANILRKILTELGIHNIYLLDNQTKKIGGVHFVGGTLWTDCNKSDPTTLYSLQNSLNDFKHISVSEDHFKKFTPEQSVSEHIKTLEYFGATIKNLDDDAKVVVVSHHAPSALSVAEQYKSSHLINGGFCSDLSEFILDNPKIKLWTHGHMHDAVDYFIGSTQVVCNPKGYPNENIFNSNVVIEV